MRQIDPALSEHLKCGATTLCTCWKVERVDNVTLGFTDHDNPITFEGITYLPHAGLDASEATSNLGLSVDTVDVEGALQSDAITPTDLHSGLYDNARVTMTLINWRDTSQRLQLRLAEIGEVKCAGDMFTAELRGVSHKLNQVKGRLYEGACDADLGDRRCGIDTNATVFNGQGIITAILGDQSFLVSGLDIYQDGWFDRGLLTWQDGSNIGEKIEVLSQYTSTGGATINVWLPPTRTAQIGDTFQITAGCNKLFDTCKVKFANAQNFRGFPHMPGNDFTLGVARSNGSNDGEAVIE